jgi:ABC-2 type transport system ATP-binding protein
MKQIIEINDLTCCYSGIEAVRNLSLQVPEGSIYAFLGTNGAGKTTTIKTLLNLLEPSKGTASVLDTPIIRLRPKELAQIGYLSQDQKLPEALTVQELIDYSKSIYPTWDDVFCNRLLETLSLPLKRKLAYFSRGMKIKTALLISLAYHPRLLILDEPFSGLDALVRDELIQSLLEVFEQETWTMFISSHDIDEIERLADWVGILDQGRLCVSEPLESLRSRFRRIDIILPERELSTNHLAKDMLLPEIAGSSAKWIDPHFVNNDTTSAQIQKRFPKGTVFTTSPLSLRDIFVSVTRVLRQNPQTIL